MSTATLDMSAILLKAYELADMIVQSAELQEFLRSRARLQADPTAQKLTREFAQKKEEFAEVERYGWWHPDYRQKDAELQELKRKLDELDVVQSYLQAEDRVDKMLYHVSRTIARSVTHTIKVPLTADDVKSGGCGGCGSGGCGGRCGNG